MKKIKQIIISAVLITGIVGVGTAFAHNNWPSKGHVTKEYSHNNSHNSGKKVVVKTVHKSYKNEHHKVKVAHNTRHNGIFSSLVMICSSGW